MAEIKSLSFRDIVARGRIEAADLASLRAAVSGAGLADFADAEALIALDAACPVQVAGWSAFLADVIADFVVRQVPPEGYLNSGNADRLVRVLAPNGEVRTIAGLEILVTTLARARWAPASLSCFALDQIAFAVATGSGPLRRLIPAPAGTITPEEVEWVRRILYAAGSDGYAALTLEEARALAAIDAALMPDRIEPHWLDLFLKAMTCLAFEVSGHATDSRERVLAPSAPGSRGPSIAAGTAALFAGMSTEERALAALERQRIEIVTGEAIADGGIEWLAARLGTAVGTPSVATGRLASELAALASRLAPPLAAALAGSSEARISGVKPAGVVVPPNAGRAVPAAA